MSWEVFNELIKTVERNAVDNKFTIQNVDLWAASWRGEWTAAAIRDQIEPNDAVEKLREQYSDRELAKLIGISRTTMYKRIKDGYWKISEVQMIKRLF